MARITRSLLQGPILFSTHWIMTQVEEKIPKLTLFYTFTSIFQIYMKTSSLYLLGSSRPGVGYQIMATKGRTGNPKTISQQEIKKPPWPNL